MTAPACSPRLNSLPLLKKREVLLHLSREKKGLTGKRESSRNRRRMGQPHSGIWSRKPENKGGAHPEARVKRTLPLISSGYSSPVECR